MWRQVGWFTGVFMVLCSHRAANAQPAPVVPAPAAPGSAAEPAPATVPPPAPPAVSECFPKCRAGYTCHQGQCVSLCNPPCGDGQSCTSEGECAPLPAPPPPPPAAPSPPAVAPPPPPQALATPTPSGTEPSALRSPGTFVLAAHLGVEMYGAGRRDDEICEDSTCEPTLTTDFDDKSPVVLGLDGLFHASRGVRLGLGYWLVPYSAIGAEPNKATTVHLGSEHELNAIVEGLAPLRPNLALVLRAQGGPRLLVSGGDLANGLDSFLSSCSRLPVDQCKTDKGPFFGGQFATAVGLVFGNRVRARFELGIERYFVKAGERKIIDQSQTTSSSSSNAGTRLWALAGVEL